MTDALRIDLRYATRALRRAPAFSITVILVLALGIGLTSAMFNVFESVVLARLPVRDQDRIVELAGMASGAATEFPILPAQFERFRTLLASNLDRRTKRLSRGFVPVGIQEQLAFEPQHLGIIGLFARVFDVRQGLV